MKFLILSDFRAVRYQVVLMLSVTYGVFLLPILNKYIVLARFVEFGSGPVALPLPLMPFYITLCICVIFSANIFSSLQTEKQSFFYFTLPASISEKYCSKLFVSLFLFYVLSLLSMLLFFFIHYFLSQLGTISHSLGSLRNLDSAIFRTFFFYVFCHSIYFLCSLFWRQHAFLKTSFLLLAIFGVFFTIYLVGSILFFQRSVLEHIGTIDPDNFEQNMSLFRLYLSRFFNVFYYLLPLLLYILAFLKLKTKQILE